MKSPLIRTALILVAILLGFFMGELYRKSVGSAAPPADRDGTASDTSRAASANHSYAGAFLQNETNGFWESDDLAEDIDRHYRKTRSPLRSRSALAYHVQERSFDEWAMKLEDGQILRPDLLRDVGERLAETDPVRAMDLLLVDRAYRLENMDQYYALRSGILQTVALQHPEIGLKALQGLERGGVQMDNSLYFSAQLAWFTPEVAVSYFDDLVVLRNMDMQGSAALPRGRYADAIMESWLVKDKAAAISYTEGLSEEPIKDAFMKSIEKRTSNTD